MAHKRQRTRSIDRTMMPDGLTEMLMEKINALPYSVKTEYLKAEIQSKYVSPDTDPPQVRRQRAINKWLATERENEATNDRLLIFPGEYNILPRVPYSRFVDFCRDLIVEIIGETPPIEALIGSFSGGASTSRKRTESHPAGKYLGKAHATPRCFELFKDLLIDELPTWLGVQADYDLEIEIVPGNVLFTVPKKTDIDRVACKEPDINMFVQKGIGNFFRRSLRRIGINLNDQSINRKLARIGSIDSSLATLDLSSASDSVSTGLVAEMLPVCWYTLLDSVRSPVTIIDGEEHVNHMFSSMGNGFTFELESLLFYVLTRATAYFKGVRGIVSVYGDDIICPSSIVRDLTWVLQYFGFQVNPDKSFSTGSFRESCGGHYDNGNDITPFYIKAPITTLPDLIDVANKLRKWAELPGLSILDPEVEDIWIWLKSMVPNVLWGGVDTSFKYQLVSYDLPKLRIYEETKRRSTGIGGYLHWLNTTWERESVGEGVSTSSLTTNLNRYRFRPISPSVTRTLEHLFSHEILTSEDAKATEYVASVRKDDKST